MEFFVRSSIVPTTAGNISFLMTASAEHGIRLHSSALPGVWMPWTIVQFPQYLIPAVTVQMKPDDFENLIILFKRAVYKFDKKAEFTCGPLSGFTDQLL
jgi:hypothetical protein